MGTHVKPIPTDFQSYLLYSDRMVFLFQQLTFHAVTRMIFKNTNYLQNTPG